MARRHHLWAYGDLLSLIAIPEIKMPGLRLRLRGTLRPPAALAMLRETCTLPKEPPRSYLRSVAQGHALTSECMLYAGGPPGGSKVQYPVKPPLLLLATSMAFRTAGCWFFFYNFMYGRIQSGRFPVCRGVILLY